MKPKAFKDWRLRNDLTQDQAAKLLGYTVRWIRAFETGFVTPGKKAVIPRAVALACWAIQEGKTEWDGH